MDEIQRAISEDFNKSYIDKVKAFNSDYDEFSVDAEGMKIGIGKNSDYGLKKIDFVAGTDFQIYLDNNNQPFTAETGVVYILKTVNSIKDKGVDYYNEIHDSVTSFYCAVLVSPQ